MSEIRLTYGDRAAGAIAPESITFGRSADLVLGEHNLRMHRIVGRFVGTATSWSVENHATAYHLTVASGDASWSTTVSPGSAAALPTGTGHVTVDLGDVRYTVEYSHEAEPLELVAPSSTGEPTVDAPPVRLRLEQRLLLTAMAEPGLRQPGSWPPPSPPPNKEVASRLGWKITKFNRKLDYLCRRLAKLGVEGLIGDSTQLATDRRRILVQWAVATGAVRVADLALLDPSENAYESHTGAN